MEQAITSIISLAIIAFGWYLFKKWVLDPIHAKLDSILFKLSDEGKEPPKWVK